MKNEKKSILVIEDNQIIQNFYRIVLSDNFQVVLVGTGKEALKQMKNLYDAILLDIGLPDISGIDLAKKIRLKNQHTPIICISTQIDDHDTKEKCIEAGINAMHVKPIGGSQLEDLVNYWINQ